MSAARMIVIGASAGGIEALQQIVSGFPKDFQASILVVVHTAAQDGHLAEVLGRRAHMRSVTAVDGMHIVPGQIYVAPPDQHFTVTDSRVVLDRGPKVNRHRPAIDPLFETAANAYGQRLVGVVLTGYLDDGTLGLATVKAKGGVCVVQDPKEAVAPNMPKSAMLRVNVDYCLPLSEIAPLLIQLVDGKKVRKNHRK